MISPDRLLTLLLGAFVVGCVLALVVTYMERLDAVLSYGVQHLGW